MRRKIIPNHRFLTVSASMNKTVKIRVINHLFDLSAFFFTTIKGVIFNMLKSGRANNNSVCANKNF